MLWKNALWVIDFDKTLTIKDTIALLAQFALDHSTTTTTTKPWSFFTQAYLNDYRQHQPPPHHDLDSLLIHLNSYKPIELASIERINQHRVFEGLTSEMLYNQGQKHQSLLQPHMLSFLQAVPKQSIRIVSVNWSREWIRGFLQPLDLKPQQIFANDIQAGQIVPSIVTTGDKQRTISQFNPKGTPVIYIGDYLGNLEPLVRANVGIVMGQDPELEKIKNEYQLGLISVKDWLEAKEKMCLLK
ncbi:unnamed protein product [Rhizopus stolonifer]